MLRLPERNSSLLFCTLLAAAGSACSACGTSASDDGAPAQSAGGAVSSAGGSDAGGSDVGGSDVGSGGARTIDFCNTCRVSKRQGALSEKAINEASGMVASRKHADAFYVHNDSGDSARFFAINGAGKRIAEFQFEGVNAVDWEDIAAGPCDGDQCLYFGDIGDNNEARDDYVVYRTREPKTLSGTANALPFDAIAFHYPDGSHNAETLLVHPTTGELFILTKAKTGPSLVYQFPMPLDPKTDPILTKVAEVSPPTGSPKFTGGDVHPFAMGVLLRTYTNIFFYSLEGDLAAALQNKPCALPAILEIQGETVAWAPKGDGYSTVSEGVDSAINHFDCGK